MGNLGPLKRIAPLRMFFWAMAACRRQVTSDKYPYMMKQEGGGALEEMAYW